MTHLERHTGHRIGKQADVTQGERGKRQATRQHDGVRIACERACRTGIGPGGRCVHVRTKYSTLVAASTFVWYLGPIGAARGAGRPVASACPARRRRCGWEGRRLSVSTDSWP